MVQTVDQIDQIVTLVCCGVIECVGRQMQKFVGQAIAQGFNDFLRIFALGQELLRPLHFMAPVPFGLVPQRTYGGHQLRATPASA